MLEAAGADVKLTREGDYALSDVERVQISEAFRADRFLRIGHAPEPPMIGYYFSSPGGRAWALHARAAFDSLGLQAAAHGRGRAVSAAADLVPGALRFAGARGRAGRRKSACSRPARCAPRPTRSTCRWRSNGRPRPPVGRAIRSTVHGRRRNAASRRAGHARRRAGARDRRARPRPLRAHGERARCWWKCPARARRCGAFC